MKVTFVIYSESLAKSFLIIQHAIFVQQMNNVFGEFIVNNAKGIIR